MTRIETYTVGALARASGVSVRTLHHYDAIGLLRPVRAGANGYRVYSRADALRLQEILFYRAAGMPLAEIAALIDSEDPTARLSAHRAQLAQALGDHARMLATLDRTLAELKGAPPVTIDTLYAPFPPEQQAEYEDWLIATYGDRMAEAVTAARAREAVEPVVTSGAAVDALRRIEADLVAAFEAGCAPEAADLAAHREWVGEMWGRPCTRAAHAGLAEIYLAHPDFIARFEALSPGFSQWLAAAMKAAADGTG